MAKGKVTDAQAKINWDAYFKNFIAAVVAESNESETDKRARMQRLEADFEAWKVYYFPKYCKAPAAPFHKKASKRILSNPEWYESRVWARELAKDVVCMMETLYQGLTGQKRNILLISNSWDKAAELITPYKLNLEANERIINDYGIQQLPGSWRDGDFTTTQGVSFLAVGADQSPRGSRNEEVRPDKVIVSDIDTDQDVLNVDIINKRWSWFEKAVFPTRSVSEPFQVIFLGNLIAEDCCVARAMKMADHVDIINLEDKNGYSTWPEKNTPENIARIKSKISIAAFEAEYMNNPLQEGEIFKELTFADVPPLNRFKYLIAYADPATSNNVTTRKNSTKALWLMGKLNGRTYVIKGFLDRATNSDFVDWFWLIRDYVNGKTTVMYYIENNSLQNPFFEQVFKPLFKARSEQKGYIGITPDTRKKPEKYYRIEGNLEPPIREGSLVFNIKERENPHMKTLVGQFRLFSKSMKAPTDGPDCIEGGSWVLHQKQAGVDLLDPKTFKVINNKRV